ncbi:tRNA adenosine(34) deaminase TadA [Candidatus Neptunichlamydia sp. REUL1]|uniref:tRNA adenosine(34) deaminase TadA n=1 Tax=Candidatus Neptunichlamydia sp. REUL1 TaxID=3064277 RepID=UPI00403E0EC0
MDKKKFDTKMMEKALKEAQKAYDLDEVPVGAVLTRHGEILSRAYNQMEGRRDPSAHAELLCIREGAQLLGDWRLLETTLYTTLEPCLMCAGALLLARVGRIVYGAPDLRHGAHGSYLNVFEKKHPTHTTQIEGGLLEAQSAKLMRNFFKQQRKKNEAAAGSAL